MVPVLTRSTLARRTGDDHASFADEWMWTTGVLVVGTPVILVLLSPISFAPNMRPDSAHAFGSGTTHPNQKLRLLESPPCSYHPARP